MTEQEILEEITSFDTSYFSDGMSFGEHFEQTHSQYPCEIILFSAPDELFKKYYYNYSEKMLRYIRTDHKNVVNNTEISESDHIFDAINDADESIIPFSSKDIVDKVVVYDDYRKLITYDSRTGHYECFFVDIDEQRASEIIDDFKKVYSLGRPMVDNSVVEVKEDKENNENEVTDEEFSKAASVIAKWMLSCASSSVTFTYVDGSIELDIHSKLYFNDENELQDD